MPPENLKGYHPFLCKIFFNHNKAGNLYPQSIRIFKVQPFHFWKSLVLKQYGMEFHNWEKKYTEKREFFRLFARFILKPYL
jgi:hypothetical protein